MLLGQTTKPYIFEYFDKREWSQYVPEEIAGLRGEFEPVSNCPFSCATDHPNRIPSERRPFPLQIPSSRQGSVTYLRLIH